MRMCLFRAQNGPFVLNKIFLVQTIIITFIYHWPFSLYKMFKNSYSGSRVVRMCHLWDKFFFGKLLKLFSSTLPISPSDWAKFKKNSSSRSRVMRMHNFWAQNDPFSKMRIFSENLLMSLISFIHVYLHAKN